MNDFVSSHLAAIESAVSLAILVAVYFTFKFRIDFWWLNFWYALPVIGKTARLSRDSSRSNKDQSWTNSERTLCSDFKQFLHLVPEAEFNNRIEYLAKAGDTGRTPTPGWLILLLALLITAEGLGFSYLLGSWMAMDGSENTRQLLMWGIVFVLCVILGFLTHSAGHQLHRTNLIRRCEKEWRDDGQKGRLRTANVTLKDKQSCDDAVPHYSQSINRVGAEGSYVLVWVAAAAILVIAVASTVMRVKHLESEQGRETVQATAAPADAGNPFAQAGQLPAAIVAPQAAADAKARSDINRSTETEGLSAFVMLAFIFVITQLVGIIAGYRWGFAGQNSKEAFRSTLGFATYDDYMRFFGPIIDKAEARLGTLQQRIMARQSNIHLRLSHTFADFLHEQQAERAARRQAVPDPSPRPTAQQVVASVEAFGEDKDAAKAYLMTLDESLRNEAIPLLRERKQQREQARTAAMNQELDDVL